MNVKTLCLGILHFGDATGYEIRKMAQEGRFGHFIEASYGSIYPALIGLENSKLVSSRKESNPGRPDRKVYSINEAGRADFNATLQNDPREDIVKSEFLFVMMCADLLPGAHITHLLDQRLSQLEAKIAHLKDVNTSCEHQGSRFVIGYGLAMYEATHAYLANHRQNIESFASSGTQSLGDAAE